MSHHSVVIVRHDTDLAAVRDTFAGLETAGLVRRVTPQETGSVQRLEVELPDSVFDDIEALEQQLQKLARKFGLHLALVLAVSASDSFLYVHWYSGRIVRALGCGVDEESMWSRATGEPEAWEAQAFEGEEVTGRNHKPRLLGLTEEGSIESPRRGDLSLPPDAMKYAEAALAFF